MKILGMLNILLSRLKAIGMVRTTFVLSSGLTIGGLLGVMIFVTGCSPAVKEWTPNSKPLVYTVSGRKFAPEPTYNRLTWVRAPEPLPSREIAESNGPMIKSIFHLTLANSTVEEATSLLAQSARYHSYTASSVARNKLSIDAMGTIEELADSVSKKTGARVIVDHENKEIRTLARVSEALKPASPRFME